MAVRIKGQLSFVDEDAPGAPTTLYNVTIDVGVGDSIKPALVAEAQSRANAAQSNADILNAALLAAQS